MTTRALSTGQERRLATWLDEQLLNLTRGYKKRSQPDSPLQTLPSYLDAAQTILTVILRVPPIDNSSSLRVAYLLRLTNDALSAIPGYSAALEHIQRLLDWLDDLDSSWLVVLRAQIWHPDTGPEDLELEVEEVLMNRSVKVSPVTQTERTRLRSLIIGASAALEEWVEDSGLLHLSVGDQNDENDEEGGGTVQDAFGELFHRTLNELGELEGVLVPVGLEEPVVDCVMDAEA